MNDQCGEDHSAAEQGSPGRDFIVDQPDPDGAEETKSVGVDVELVVGEAMIHTWPFFAEARYCSRCVGFSRVRKE